MRGPTRRWIVATTVAVAGVALAGVIPASAAPPANDAFASAQPIAGESGSISGTNVDATKESGEPNHADDPGGRSVWYRWVAPTSGPYSFDTCGSQFDTLLGVYTGTVVSSLTEIASNDDVCDVQSTVVFSATAGTTYSIAVDGFQETTAATGTFTLRWHTVTAPPNDNFASAQELTGARGTVEGTNVGATAEPGEPAVEGSLGASVWYRWTAPEAGTAMFETCGGQGSFDTLLAAYTGESVSGLTRLASNDDQCGLQSRIRFPARAGVTYRIKVDGVEGTTGAFRLSWLVAQPPANDRIAAARRIAGARGSLRGSNEAASRERGEPAHAGAAASASVWYRWRAPRTMGIRFETCTATFDTLLAVYRGRVPRAANRVAQNDDACRELGSRVNFVAIRGVDYLIAVDGLSNSTGTFLLAWGAPARNAQCRVPDVRGLTVAQASRAIQGAGCRVGRVVSGRSALVPRGRVISQFPAPGRRVRFLTRVNLEINR